MGPVTDAIGVPASRTSGDADVLAEAAIQRASRWLARAERLRGRSERARRRRMARLLADPAGLPVTMHLTDEVMRMGDPQRALSTLHGAAVLSTREALGLRDHLGLRSLDVLSRIAPRAAVQMVHRQVQAASHGIILPAEAADLAAHMRRRAEQGAVLNINVLGEAVLGEREAQDRLARVLAMVRRPTTTHVSVKISAIVAQLNVFDHAGSIDRVVERLRPLLLAASQANPPRFVALDMEEYRDLDLTLAAFRRVLGEDDLTGVSAGVVLQAYLPESHAALAGLIEWATARRDAGGAGIKVRIVKGANLAMERAEAQIHGWPAAPFPTKALVDASWKRLVDSALGPRTADVLRVGIASHNLFDVAWAVELANARGVPEQVDVEMLEGMAEAESRAVAEDVGRLLMYAPVTREGDFPAAVAYLVRRLDENTAPENYLRASFDLAPGGPGFAAQADLFRAALAARGGLDTTSIRHGSPPVGPPLAAPGPLRTSPAGAGSAESVDVAHAISGGIDGGPAFANVAELDLTRPDERARISRAMAEVGSSSPVIPVVVAGVEHVPQVTVPGTDPGSGAAPWYATGLATPDVVAEAIAVARSAVAPWESFGAAGRAGVLASAARLMFEERHTTLAVMARDAGKTVAEGIPEVAEAIDFARFYAASAQQVESWGPSRPLGVVVVIPPWNFPYAIPAGGVLAALAAGNSVILKPAPETRATAWLLAQQLWAAGVPRDVLTFLPCGDDEAGRALVIDPEVDAVVLTGSWQTARMFLSWRPGLRLLAETSGKNAMLISGTADVEAAVRDLVASAFGHAGQKCSAASLAIVESDVYDDPTFRRQLADAVTSLRVASALDPASVVGPLIKPPEGALERALTRLDPGERWLVEPQRMDASGHLWSPGVRLGVEPESWSHLNEWFGPVLGVMRAPDLATGLQWQNSTGYGLTAGVQALDQDECAWWIQNVAVGNAYVNRGTTGAIVNRQPFGGWRRSSVGPTAKAGGENYVPCLREWPAVREALDRAAVQSWWQDTGGAARDSAGLDVERNIVRFRHYDEPILVRVDAATSRATLESVRVLAECLGASVQVSADPSLARAEGLPGDTHLESISHVAAAVAEGRVGRIRWLSAESATRVIGAAVGAGVSVDSRPITPEVRAEGPRWLREQSVSVTAHRYGNVGAGPQPEVRGLAG